MANKSFRYSNTFIRTVVLVSKKRRVNHFRIRSRQLMVASLSLSSRCWIKTHRQILILKLAPSSYSNICRNNTKHYLNHDSYSLDMPLEVKVEELILQPLSKAGGHLSFQLLYVLISRCDEVPLKYLRETAEEEVHSVLLQLRASAQWTHSFLRDNRIIMLIQNRQNSISVMSKSI